MRTFICLLSARLRSELDAFMPIRLSTAQRKRLCRAGAKREAFRRARPAPGAEPPRLPIVGRQSSNINGDLRSPKCQKVKNLNRPARNKNENKIDHDEVSAIARRHTPQAIRTLVFLSENAESEMARIAAARALLEYGHGRPPVQVDVNAAGRVDHIVYRSEAEFREALLERGIPARLLPPPVLEGPEFGSDRAGVHARIVGRRT